MLKHLSNTEQGFTLMELLIAVGIVAVLAGVGIPIYMGLQSGAKASEATANLDGIGTCMEAYKLTNGTYIDCYRSPVADTAVDENQNTWAAVQDPVTLDTGFSLIGFDTNKPVRFAYAVGGANNTTYYAGAIGDSDGDTDRILYVSWRTNTDGAGPHIIDTTNVNDAAAVAAGAGLNSTTAYDPVADLDPALEDLVTD